jgi:plasmid stabilization system protein ParE
MKVVYTDEALRDLDEILDYIASHYPTISSSFEKRLTRPAPAFILFAKW